MVEVLSLIRATQGARTLMINLIKKFERKHFNRTFIPRLVSCKYAGGKE